MKKESCGSASNATSVVHPDIFRSQTVKHITGNLLDRRASPRGTDRWRIIVVERPGPLHGAGGEHDCAGRMLVDRGLRAPHLTVISVRGFGEYVDPGGRRIKLPIGFIAEHAGDAIARAQSGVGQRPMAYRFHDQNGLDLLAFATRPYP